MMMIMIMNRRLDCFLGHNKASRRFIHFRTLYESEGDTPIIVLVSHNAPELDTVPCIVMFDLLKRLHNFDIAT